MSLRNRELVNLVLVGVVGTAAFGSAWIAHTNRVSAEALVDVALIAGLFLAAHLVVRRTAAQADPTLLPLVALLTSIGLTMNFRLNPADGRRQAVWVAIGIVAFALTLVLLRFDYRVLEQYRYVFGVTAIILLLLPSLPVIGQRVNGVRLWVHVGRLQFQPGEVAKLLLVLFLAGYLREKREVLAQGRLKDFGPLLVIWGAAMLVLLQTSDLGSALLYFGVFVGMLYVATDRLSYVLAGGALFVLGSGLLYSALSRVQARVIIWLHPWTDHKIPCFNGTLDYRQNCQSYQLVRSLYSIGNGGYGGTGIGRETTTTLAGTPLIPELNTDFIFSAITQGIGLIGAAGVILVFMVLVARGMRVSLLAQDGFSKLLAVGLAFGLALQTFIIVGGVLRVVPLTGITLPFVSYGGSSVLANFIALALLLLVSHRARITGAAR